MSSPVLWEGLLNKRKKNKVKGWIKRYFVLRDTDRGGVLEYYADKRSADNKIECKEIFMLHATVERTELERPFTFDVTPIGDKSVRTYHLSASTNAELQGWLRMLRGSANPPDQTEIYEEKLLNRVEEVRNEQLQLLDRKIKERSMTSIVHRLRMLRIRRSFQTWQQQILHLAKREIKQIKLELDDTEQMLKEKHNDHATLETEFDEMAADLDRETAKNHKLAAQLETTKNQVITSEAKLAATKEELTTLQDEHDEMEEHLVVLANSIGHLQDLAAGKAGTDEANRNLMLNLHSLVKKEELLRADLKRVTTEFQSSKTQLLNREQQLRQANSKIKEIQLLAQQNEAKQHEQHAVELRRLTDSKNAALVSAQDSLQALMELSSEEKAQLEKKNQSLQEEIERLRHLHSQTVEKSRQDHLEREEYEKKKFLRNTVKKMINISMYRVWRDWQAEVGVHKLRKHEESLHELRASEQRQATEITMLKAKVEQLLSLQEESTKLFTETQVEQGALQLSETKRKLLETELAANKQNLKSLEISLQSKVTQQHESELKRTALNTQVKELKRLHERSIKDVTNKLVVGKQSHQRSALRTAIKTMYKSSTSAVWSRWTGLIQTQTKLTTLKSLEQNLEIQTTKSRELEKEKELLEAKVQELQSLQANIEFDKKKQDIQRKSVQQIESKRSDHEKSLLRIEVETKTKELNEASAEIEELKLQLTPKHLADKLEAFQSQINMGQQLREELERKLKAETTALRNANSKLIESSRFEARLQTAIAREKAAQQQLADCHYQIATLEAENQELTEAISRASDLAKQKLEANERLAEQRIESIEKLRAHQLEARTIEHTALKEEHDKVVAHNEELMLKHTQVTQAKQALANKLSSVDKSHARANNALLEEIEDHKTQLHVSSLNVTEAEKKVAQAKQQVKQVGVEFNNKYKTKVMGGVLRRMVNLKVHRAWRDWKSFVSNKHVRAVELLKKEVKMLRRKNKQVQLDLTDQFNTKHFELINREKDLTQEKTSLYSTVNTHTVALSGVSHNYRALHAEYEKLKAQYDFLSKEHEQVCIKYDDLFEQHHDFSQLTQQAYADLARKRLKRGLTRIVSRLATGRVRGTWNHWSWAIGTSKENKVREMKHLSSKLQDLLRDRDVATHATDMDEAQAMPYELQNALVAKNSAETELTKLSHHNNQITKQFEKLAQEYTTLYKLHEDLTSNYHTLTEYYSTLNNNHQELVTEHHEAQNRITPKHSQALLDLQVVKAQRDDAVEIHRKHTLTRVLRRMTSINIWRAWRTWHIFQQSQLKRQIRNFIIQKSEKANEFAEGYRYLARTMVEAEEDQLTALTQEKTQLQAEIETHSATIQNLEAHVKTTGDTNVRLNTELDTVKLMLETEQGMSEAVSEKLAEAQREIMKLQTDSAKLAHVQTELSHVREEYSLSLNTSKATATSTIVTANEKLNVKLSKVKQQLTNATQQIRDLDGIKSDYEIKLNSMTDLKLQLEQELNVTNTKLHEALAVIEHYSTQDEFMKQQQFDSRHVSKVNDKQISELNSALHNRDQQLKEEQMKALQVKEQHITSIRQLSQDRDLFQKLYLTAQEKIALSEGKNFRPSLIDDAVKLLNSFTAKIGLIPSADTKMQGKSAGCLILSVEEGSAAAVAGVRPGHCIEEINGKPTRTFFELKQVLDTVSPGDQLLCHVDTGNGRIKLMTIQVNIKEIDIDYDSILTLKRIGSGIIQEGDLELVDAIIESQSYSQIIATADAYSGSPSQTTKTSANHVSRSPKTKAKTRTIGPKTSGPGPQKYTQSLINKLRSTEKIVKKNPTINEQIAAKNAAATALREQTDLDLNSNGGGSGTGGASPVKSVNDQFSDKLTELPSQQQQQQQHVQLLAQETESTSTAALPSPPLVKAMASFQGRKPNQLSFSKGDLVEVVHSEGQWHCGILKKSVGFPITGQALFYPSNFFEAYISPPEEEDTIQTGSAYNNDSHQAIDVNVSNYNHYNNLATGYDQVEEADDNPLSHSSLMNSITSQQSLDSYQYHDPQQINQAHEAYLSSKPLRASQHFSQTLNNLSSSPSKRTRSSKRRPMSKTIGPSHSSEKKSSIKRKKKSSKKKSKNTSSGLNREQVRRERSRSQRRVITHSRDRDNQKSVNMSRSMSARRILHPISDRDHEVHNYIDL